MGKDKLDRLENIKLQTTGSYAEEQSYTYENGNGSTYTTTYINKISYGSTSESYSYDDNGNVKTVTTAGGTITYTYDGLNRLTQEINNVTKKKYNYTYDAGGNILTKKITNLTTGYTDQQIYYTYDNANKDRLVRVGYDNISGYDSQGRPTNYRGWKLSWNNGSVSKFVKNGKTVTATYDANGIRVEKSVGNITHKYYLEENNIVREQVTGNSNYNLYYMYGLDGIVGFTYVNGATSKNYYYRKNLFGDIIAIFDGNGTVYARYVYDAWGNCSILQDTNGIGTLNPFRYRGYYYDSELNLYYLNARYYDPEIGRFISQDDISYLDPETLNGLNLFAYCLNNPVMDTDPDGTAPWWYWLAAVAIAAISIAVTVATAGAAVAVAATVAGATIGLVSGITNAASKGEDLVEGALKGMLSGITMTNFAMAGGSLVSGGAFQAGFILSATGGVLGGVIDETGSQLSNGNKIYLDRIVERGVQGAISNVIGTYVGAWFGGVAGNAFAPAEDAILGYIISLASLAFDNAINTFKKQLKILGW